MVHDFSLDPKSTIILLFSVFMWMTLPTSFNSTRVSSTHPLFCIIACGCSTFKVLSHTPHFPTTNSCYPYCSKYPCLFTGIGTGPIPLTPCVRLFSGFASIAILLGLSTSTCRFSNSFSVSVLLLHFPSAVLTQTWISPDFFASKTTLRTSLNLVYGSH